MLSNVCNNSKQIFRSIKLPTQWKQWVKEVPFLFLRLYYQYDNMTSSFKSEVLCIFPIISIGMISERYPKEKDKDVTTEMLLIKLYFFNNVYMNNLLIFIYTIPTVVHIHILHIHIHIHVNESLKYQDKNSFKCFSLVIIKN